MRSQNRSGSVMRADRLAALVEAAVPDPDGPGVVVGLVDADGSLETAARGMAVLEHEVPISDRTVFHLASVSKQFTAEAVRSLVGADEQIGDYLPWVPFPHLTIEQLVQHRSGLRDQWQLVEAAGWRMEDVITTADLVELIRRQTTLQSIPGTTYEYSNTNYTLLGLLVETVAGESLDSYCRKQLFEPLGMADTAFVASHRAVVRRRASSYARTATGYERIALSYATVGATSLHSTVTDLARWAASVSSRESWRGTTYTGSDSYGWGVHIGEHAGELKLWHAGADAGFRTHLAMVPGVGSAVVLGNFAELDPDALASQVLDLLESPSSDGRFVGTYYSDELMATVRVVPDEQGLAFERPRYGRRRMTPVGERAFTVPGDEAEVTLRFDQTGAELGYSTPEARDLVFRRSDG
ncbi:serine hydrolase domain-containing protein [Kribbella sp. CA-245084]|uniref:serine hydrolase domain-containing protein n=1 Tax=Kribbella sp. CA-245084 TaxID=3239940 RepID=UPI003D91718F